MKFVENTGANWAAVQIRAVEMEIEQQKREWEEKRLLQRQQEELEKQRLEKEENEVLTYSREDALNKVNIKPKMKSQMLGKRKSGHSTNSEHSGKKLNGTEVTRNGISNDIPHKSGKFETSSIKVLANPVRRNTRNSVTRPDEAIPIRVRNRRSSVAARKSDRSSSMHSAKSNVRSTSESTSRSNADSTSHRTNTRTPDDSDSECSLDVMIDSNDVNDSDSNSNAGNLKMRARFASSSQDDETLQNDDSTMTDDTTLEQMSRKSNDSQAFSKDHSSPRTTRSRGTIALNLWTLDESPIMAPKRQKLSSRNSSDVKSTEEKQLREFNVKECKVSIVDIQNSKNKMPEDSKFKSSPKPRKRLSAPKNNQTLDSWILPKPSEISQKINSEEGASGKEDAGDRVTRQRRQTVFINQTN